MANFADTFYQIGTPDKATTDRLFNAFSTHTELCDVCKALDMPNVARGYVELVSKEGDTALDVALTTTWDEQPAFIAELERLGCDVLWNCEEPGNNYYHSNIEGGMFGLFKVVTYEEEDYANTISECVDMVNNFLRDFHRPTYEGKANIYALQSFLDEYNAEENIGDDTIKVFQFSKS